MISVKGQDLMRILIKNGYIVNPAEDFEGVCDILIENEIIVKMEENISESVDSVIDASGLHVFPGLVDMHVHLRDPGFIHKEDIITGGNSAVAGGITSLLCMPNTNPIIDNEKVVDYINKKAKDSKPKIYICGAITKNLDGGELSDFHKLKNAGVIAMSDDGKPVKNAALLTKALKWTKKLGFPLISHCEDLDIVADGIVNTGKVSKELKLKGMHRSSEDSITAREVVLAKTSNSAVHIAHVSTRLSTDIVRTAKKNGTNVTAETCPQYFVFTEDEIFKMDADYRMNPPLRESEDLAAIIEGVKDGTFDCIVTDHAPHTPDEKRDFINAPNGVVGMDTSFAASYTYLVEAGHISLNKLIELMSSNPAKLLGIDAGALKIGGKADITIANLSEEWIVDPNKLASRSKNYIFKGKKLLGKVKYTFVDGNKVFEDKK